MNKYYVWIFSAVIISQLKVLQGILTEILYDVRENFKQILKSIQIS